VDVAQRHVLDRIAQSIRRAGAPVMLAGRGDLAVGGRKCAGSAQRRLKHWFMVHCSILYDFPIERIARYLTVPQRQPEYRQGRDHQDFLSNLGLPRKILVDAIRGEHPAGSCSARSPEVPPAVVASLLTEKFSNRAWIERF
jgi:lipoate-protein ligase A